MQTYELKLEEFKGPLDKLLELIEDKKLEITKINIASVTADFLNYVNSLNQLNTSAGPKILADFISVASKLILIKSHTLIPSLELSSEEKEEIKDLEDRLRLYKEFKAAEKNIKSLWAKKVSYSRDFFLEVGNGFYLSQPITPENLKKIVEEICRELTVIFPKIEAGKVKLINFEEKIKELLERVTKATSANFSEIAKGKDRTEIVVIFLAILHLLKDNLVRIEQNTQFEEIKIEKVGSK